ncbi:unnamed protein product [Calicophoron daubneyi]|uniref:WD repeat-containing protein 27 n=1 Tax=Calicophoron daubneyi TaxID=300641 RepID=A0AAV2TMM3_CALDB
MPTSVLAIQKPSWTFLEPEGYDHLDIWKEYMCFCRLRLPTKVYLCNFQDIPESIAAHECKENIKFLKIVHSKVGLVLLVASTTEIQIIQLESPCVNLRPSKHLISSFSYTADTALSVLFDVDCTIRFLAATEGSNLRIRTLKNSPANFVNLGSHCGEIVKLCFHPTNSELLLTTAEDHVCKVWNIGVRQLVQNIHLQKLSPHAISHHPREQLFLLGTTEGRILSVYYETGSYEYSELFRLKHRKILATTFTKKTEKSIGSGRSHWSEDRTFIPSISEDVELYVLSMLYITTSDESEELDWRRTVYAPIRLAIITSTRFCIVDITSSEVEMDWTWSELGLLNWPYVLGAGMTGTKRSLNFWIRGIKNEICFFTLPLNDHKRQPRPTDLSAGDVPEHSGCSVSLLANGSLNPDSVLQKSIRRRPTSSTSNSNVRKSKKSSSLNKPVTFGHSIKSSGYAVQEPRRKLFQPNTTTRSSVRTIPNTRGLDQLTRVYLRTDEVPDFPCYSGSADSVTTPVYHLAYSTTGNRLAAALGNGVCLLLRCPAPTEGMKTSPLPSSLALSGHKGPILSTSWSSDNRFLLTSSSDCTARLWAVGEVNSNKRGNKQQPRAAPRSLLVMDQTNGGATNCFGEKTTIRTGLSSKGRIQSAETTFSDSIPFAHFHYLDAFIYLVCRNVIRLFSYDISDGQNILERGRPTNFYKLAGEFAVETCNRLTAVSSVNIFYSYLILCAGSDHRLSVLDLNANKIIQEMESAHSRNITGIALNQGSLYSSFTQMDEEVMGFNTGCFNASYTTYATVAPGDCVRMWDLRDSARPVMQFSRLDTGCCSTGFGIPTDSLVPSVNLAFSPCGRRIVVGGRVSPNQNHPVIYDTRRPCAHPLATLNPVSGQASSFPVPVAVWHPLRPEITTGSHGGQLTTYSIKK